MTTYGTDLALALQLADAADSVTRARFRATDLRVERKPDRTPVTDADLAVEDAVRAILGRERPGDDIAGEERGGKVGSGRTWVLDPIDGTKNFLRGVPAWGTLIALVDGGRPVVGVVSAPALGQRWWASRGEGAWTRKELAAPESAREPRRLQVSAVGDLGDAYLSTTHLNSWREHHSREKYLALVDAVWETRAFGDFWHYCLVAEGALDIATEAIVNPWDVAAVKVLIEEAGGTFTDLSGRDRFDGGSAIGTNGRLHRAALAILAR
ncbi:histidinol-phosphatase [Pendulispora albinea]|uniref:Histidinol-phosphatase n=1 Tax=Pendulispora albinea TaxID=2741071 RepID=A0ABZ2LLK1_9BACT